MRDKPVDRILTCIIIGPMGGAAVVVTNSPTKKRGIFWPDNAMIDL